MVVPVDDNNSTPNVPARAENGTTFTPERADRFLDLQERELQIRSEEADVRRHEIDANSQYARASIEAQLKDNEAERRFTERIVSKRHRFTGFVIVVLLIFAGALIYFDKDVLLTALIQAGVIGIGAFLWGRYRAKESADVDSE